MNLFWPVRRLHLDVATYVFLKQSKVFA